jgi:hypothetical protein
MGSTLRIDTVSVGRSGTMSISDAVRHKGTDSRSGSGVVLAFDQLEDARRVIVEWTDKRVLPNPSGERADDLEILAIAVHTRRAP